MKKAVSILIACVMLSAVPVTPAAASSAYFSYTYDSWGTAVPSQAGYEAGAEYTAKQLDASLNDFKSPQDLFVDNDGLIYVLDSGNKRVVCLNSNMTLNRVIDTFSYKNEKVSLNSPTGLFVTDDGMLYIADPGNHMVIICDREGSVKRILERPETNMLSENLEFLPQKVLVDSAGMVYVTVSNVYQGSLLYDQKGDFQGFYGSNEVQVTASLLLDKMWKKLLSDEQASNISQYVPEEFTSFDIDDKDFVYTVTQSTSVATQVKKLNPVGDNTLSSTEFGEQEVQEIGGKSTASRFIDVAVDEHGGINVIDQQSNRLFQYDKEGSLLFVMGGTGQQAGTFQSAAAIDSLGDNLLVLDSVKCSITVLVPTAFGRTVHEAVDYYNDGLYADASDLWKEVLRLDQNYELAYVSIGKSLLADGSYEEAAEYFKLGSDKEGNSDAFQFYRNEILQKFFPMACLAAILLIALLIWLYNRPAKVNYTAREQRVANPLRMLLHPVDTSQEIKQKDSGSWGWSAFILGLWYVATVFKYSLTNFRFNSNNLESMNIILLFIGTIPVFAVWVVSNWGVCTLMDGKGRIKEIWITNSYCLIPWVAAMFLYVLLSQVLIDDEVIFLQGILWIGIGWSVLLLLGTLSSIHDYFAGQTVISVLLSLLGVLIVIFLILLVCSLVQQAYDFIYSIINELLYRLR